MPRQKFTSVSVMWNMSGKTSLFRCTHPKNERASILWTRLDPISYLGYSLMLKLRRRSGRWGELPRKLVLSAAISITDAPRPVDSGRNCT